MPLFLIPFQKHTHPMHKHLNMLPPPLLASFLLLVSFLFMRLFVALHLEPHLILTGSTVHFSPLMLHSGGGGLVSMEDTYVDVGLPSFHAECSQDESSDDGSVFDMMGL
jgi:hypothetical protein